MLKISSLTEEAAGSLMTIPSILRDERFCYPGNYLGGDVPHMAAVSTIFVIELPGYAPPKSGCWVQPSGRGAGLGPDVPHLLFMSPGICSAKSTMKA